LWWTGLFLLLALGPTSAVLSQDRPRPGQYFSTMADQIADADEAEAGPFYSDRFTGRSGQAFGALFRGGYLTGPAVGREKGLAPIELMPYFFIDKGLFLMDFRGFRNDAGRYGANLGLGYRQYIEPLDRIFGVNFFWDNDSTSGVRYEQLGFGIETYGQYFDARANAYFPYGTTTKLLGSQLVSGSQRFSEHFLLYDITNTFGSALKGADAEIGVPLPGRVLQRHDVRLYAGGYYYDSDVTGSFGGWSGRLQGNLIPSLQLQLMVTNDRVFDTNVVFAVNWSYGGYRQPDGEPRNQFSRMTTPIQRQYNIVVARTTELKPDNVAINPATGAPFFFDHVASYAPPGGDGTFEHPFQTIDQTLPNSAGDIVFVHGDSVFDGDIDGNGTPDNVVALQSGVRYLGDGTGVVHTVNAVGVGLIPLPSGTTGANRPLFINGVGDGVTLASNSEFSGFVVGDPTDPTSGPTGNGIIGTGGVNNVAIRQTDVNYAGQDGMRFDGAGGGIVIANSRIFNPQGTAALHVLNGTPGIIFSGNGLPNDGDITSTGNLALYVHDIAAGSSINLTGADILNTAGNGILIDNAAGNVTVDDATITDSTTTGIQIIDSNGEFTFRGNIIVANPADDAINITNLFGPGKANFTGQGSVNINNRNAVGVNLVNNSGAIQFFGDVNMGLGFAGAAPGINWQDSSGSVLFTRVAINGSGGDGIDLGVNGANTGVFTVTGTPVITGLINNVGVNIQNNAVGSQIVFNGGVDIGGRGNQGILVLNNNGNVQFGGLSNISNPTASVDPAIDVRNNLGNVQFNDVTISNATSAGVDGYGAGVNVQDNPASFIVQGDLNITTANGIALFGLNDGVFAVPSGGLRINGGTITATGLPAVDIENSVMNIRLTSVTSTGSTREGIRLVDNVGTGGQFDFQVTGLGNGQGTGGTISGATLAGVRVDNSTLTTLPGTNTPLTYQGRVSLANMIITGSGLYGVHTIQTDAIQLLGDQIVSNTREGLLAVDTSVVDVENSQFSGNGGSNAFSEIHVVVSIPDNPTAALNGLTSDNPNTDDYQFLFRNNIITEQGADAITVETTNSGAGAHAFLTAESNEITLSASSLAAATVNWTGTIDAQFDLNTFNLISGANTGINFVAPSPLATDVATLRVLTNDFEGSVGGNTAVSVNTAGPSTITIGTLAGRNVGNTINFNGGPVQDQNGTIFLDTGYRFVNVGQNSSVVIQDTVGTITGDGATAILFTSIRAPGSVDISNNRFDITGLNGFFTERGVIFSSVVGGQLNVNSRQNNIINFNGTNFFTLFSSPANALNGTITINGINFP
jgi:hypothetical protein